MKNRIKKELEEKGYIRVRNVLNFQKDIKPVLNDLEAKADKLVERYFSSNILYFIPGILGYYQNTGIPTYIMEKLK